MTQSEMIARHLREGRTITQREAVAEYGIQRLAARIHDLRGMGMDIQEEKIQVKSRYGHAYVSRYRLAPAKPGEQLGLFAAASR